MIIPGSEAAPYRGISPHPEICASRAGGLWRLLEGFNGIVITSLAALLARLPAPSSFSGQVLHLEVKAFVPREHMLQTLRWMGYVREEPVSEVGEYSIRGGIVDVYSPSADYPVRIELFGDEIESIREFDPSTQRSIRLVPECRLSPMREMVITDVDIARWQQRAPEYWNEVRFAPQLEEKFQFTENGELFNGFESVFPLVIETRCSLFDYFTAQPGPLVIASEPDQLRSKATDLISELNESFQERWQEGDLVLSPDRLYFDAAWLSRQFEQRETFLLEQLPQGEAETARFDFQLERKYESRFPALLKDLSDWEKRNERILFVMSSQGLAERLVDILREYDRPVYFASSGFDEAFGHSVAVIQGKLSGGFYSPSLRLHVLTEGEVFGGGPARTSSRKPPPRDLTAPFLSDFRDLKPGDFVVHVEHGIGTFQGLQRIGVEENDKEFVVVSYRDDARLYVPVDRLDLLQKYSAGNESAPRIDRLGGTSWQKTKSRVRKSMRLMAEDLLKLYARREVATGHAFAADDALMHEFEEAFEFELTPDQSAAIREVKRDMEAPRPMDRLICGDVGYGKTEVGMRAAFKAVADNKQVIVLAPTTVLASQHLSTFRDRFRGFPVRVAMLSRFVGRKEQKQVLEQVRLGLVDILIGTHRLLSKDVEFSDLGLIVVDEEQRFGVAQKERLKKLKTRVDVLTLSATPIPRTLNMSLIGLRDLSIIETPPRDRLAIQTVVVRFKESIIRGAIELELQRSGQVFFVHNSIASIYPIANLLQKIVPHARIGVAHGQMPETRLERIMLGFLNFEYDVLVSTTIIENGLDISRANTLIVNQAERFGLSQLYQLRGRVGRSSRRAYAYLLTSPEETLSTDARRRLAAIREFSDLGAGFRIAALDLEIRGSGNLLGGEQHGHINAIGFELYARLLENTIRELKGEESQEEIQTSIDLRLDVQIPEHYVGDSNLRLWLYKRISVLSIMESLENLRQEVVDRFGRYPVAVANLFEYAKLRIRSRQLKITSLERKDTRIVFKFRPDTPVDPKQVIALVERQNGLRLSPAGALVLETESRQIPELFRQIHQVLDQLEGLA